MMNIDKEMISAYIRRFGSNKFNNIDGFLSHWETAKFQKGFLSKLMGEELILEKEICVKKDREIYEKEFGSMLFDDGEFRDGSFPEKLGIAFSKNNDSYMARNVDDLINVNSLVDNTVNNFIHYKEESERFINLPDGKKLKLKQDEKLLRVLRKLAVAFGLEKEYEDFRIAHSMILNDVNLKGTLCLSIHPMDYLTMSDNKSDWSSCMSWTDDGCYKVGSMEMMTASNVIVAYLKSSTSNFTFKENDSETTYEWNSKRWRELIMVTPEVIASNKSYPYIQNDLTAIVLEWVAELARKNMGFDFAEKAQGYNNEYYVEFGGFMYNDYENNDEDYFSFVRHNTAPIPHKIYVDGYGVCLHCLGSLDREDCFMCDDCLDIHYCGDCGDRLQEDDDSVYDEASGQWYCPRCQQNHVEHVCGQCGQKHLYSRPLIYKQFGYEEEVYSGRVQVCRDCFDALYRRRLITYPYGFAYRAEMELHLHKMSAEEQLKIKSYEDCI